MDFKIFGPCFSTGLFILHSFQITRSGKLINHFLFGRPCSIFFFLLLELQLPRDISKTNQVVRFCLLDTIDHKFSKQLKILRYCKIKNNYRSFFREIVPEYNYEFTFKTLKICAFLTKFANLF